jgi:hypothetical protein
MLGQKFIETRLKIWAGSYYFGKHQADICFVIQLKIPTLNGLSAISDIYQEKLLHLICDQ